MVMLRLPDKVSLLNVLRCPDCQAIILEEQSISSLIIRLDLQQPQDLQDLRRTHLMSQKLRIFNEVKRFSTSMKRIALQFHMGETCFYIIETHCLAF